MLKCYVINPLTSRQSFNKYYTGKGCREMRKLGKKVNNVDVSIEAYCDCSAHNCGCSCSCNCGCDYIIWTPSDDQASYNDNQGSSTYNRDDDDQELYLGTANAVK